MRTCVFPELIFLKESDGISVTKNMFWKTLDNRSVPVQTSEKPQSKMKSPGKP